MALKVRSAIYPIQRFVIHARSTYARRRAPIGKRQRRFEFAPALSRRVFEPATSVQASLAFLAAASRSTERGNRKIPTLCGGESSSRRLSDACARSDLRESHTVLYQ